MSNPQVINKVLLEEFRIYLKANGVSLRSCSNYISDIKLCAAHFPTSSSMTREAIRSYIASLHEQGTSVVIINRRLSSLRHFSNFLGFDFMEGVKNVKAPRQGDLIADFTAYLKNIGLGEKTISNYKSDIGRFVNWIEKNNYEIDNLDNGTIKQYLVTLKESVSMATIKRKVSAIKKFIDWRYEDSGGPLETKITRFAQKSRMQGVAMLAISLLLIIQVVVADPVKSPWSDVVASSGKSEVVLKKGQNEIRDGGVEFKEEVVDVALVEIEQAELNNEAELVLAATKENEAENIDLGLDSQIQEDAFGSARIESGKQMVLVRNKSITPYSYIYVTPTTPTGNHTIYIDEQGIGYFTASVDQAIESDISFNWWLVNH